MKWIETARKRLVFLILTAIGTGNAPGLWFEKKNGWQMPGIEGSNGRFVIK